MPEPIILTYEIKSDLTLNFVGSLSPSQIINKRKIKIHKFELQKYYYYYYIIS